MESRQEFQMETLEGAQEETHTSIQEGAHSSSLPASRAMGWGRHQQVN